MQLFCRIVKRAVYNEKKSKCLETVLETILGRDLEGAVYRAYRAKPSWYLFLLPNRSVIFSLSDLRKASMVHRIDDIC